MDTQALLDLCRINEEAYEFHLGYWSNVCQTHGCLVGNFVLARQCDTLTLNTLNRTLCAFQAIARRFEITFNESSFLFNMEDVVRDKFGRYVHGRLRPMKDREAAIRRVRKFIYWKLKRREFMHEPDGRVRESARRLEGDHNFAAQALACC